jgi:hypothetical protein
MLLVYGMPKRPRNSAKAEDLDDAAFRLVREAAAAHEPEPTPENPAVTENPEGERKDAPARWSAPTDDEVPPPKVH